VSGFYGLLPLLALAFLTGFVPPVAYPLVRAWLSARRARSLRRRLGTPTAQEDLPTLARGAPVTLEGTFRRGDGPAGFVASFHLRGVARADEANPIAWTEGADVPAWIEIGSERVALTPPFHVLAGTHHHDGSRDLGGPRPLPGTIRTVHTGDRIVARGRLDLDARSPNATTTEGGYREPARAYRLSPEDESGTTFIPIVAAVAPRYTGRRAYVAWVGIGLLAGLVSSLLAGGMGILRSRAPSACEAALGFSGALRLIHLAAPK
jgi:hypothetical protein